MEDLFEREQNTLESALVRQGEFENGTVCSAEEYAAIVKEYGRLLRQMRRITKISDKTTVDLNASKLDLLDKVHFDMMTGIYSRRFLEENLARLLSDMSRDGGSLGLLMIDVDFFKRYNDTYGHSMGDDCLRVVARALSESLPTSEDFAARYGGEEFVIVLRGAGEKQVRAVAERLLEQVRAYAISHENNDAADCVTVSVGATCAVARPSLAPEDYIRTADGALYISKGNGRNQSTFIELGGMKNDI